MDISRICIGLPEDLASRVYWVKEGRTNPLSHTPGGSDIIIEWCDGKVVGYDRVKYSSRYVKSVFRKETKIWEHPSIEIVRSKMESIYARRYDDEWEYSTVSFQEVWNASKFTKSPWDLLKEFDKDYEEYDPWKSFWTGLDDGSRANVMNILEG